MSELLEDMNSQDHPMPKRVFVGSSFLEDSELSYAILRADFDLHQQINSSEQQPTIEKNSAQKSGTLILNRLKDPYPHPPGYKDCIVLMDSCGSLRLELLSSVFSANTERTKRAGGQGGSKEKVSWNEELSTEGKRSENVGCGRQKHECDVQAGNSEHASGKGYPKEDVVYQPIKVPDVEASRLNATGVRCFSPLQYLSESDNDESEMPGSSKDDIEEGFKLEESVLNQCCAILSPDILSPNGSTSSQDDLEVGTETGAFKFKSSNVRVGVEQIAQRLNDFSSNSEGCRPTNSPERVSAVKAKAKISSDMGTRSLGREIDSQLVDPLFQKVERYNECEYRNESGQMNCSAQPVVNECIDNDDILQDLEISESDEDSLSDHSSP